MLKRTRLLPALLLLAAPLFAQSTAAPAQEKTPPNDKSVLDVKPGTPAVKTKELERKPVDPWTRLPVYLLHDQASIWTSPFHTSASDAKWWGIFGVATAALIPADKHIARQLPGKGTAVSLATWSSRIGAAYTLGSLDGAFYLLGVKTHNDRLREMGYIGAEALLDCLVVQTGLKAITRRNRPTEGNGAGHFWAGKPTLGAGSSFPSGHAMESWTFASVIAHEYPRPIIIPIAAYGLAATVCGSRLGARRHFASDVVAGAAIGWFIGDFVFARRHNPDVNRTGIGRVLSHFHVGAGS